MIPRKPGSHLVDCRPDAMVVNDGVIEKGFGELGQARLQSLARAAGVRQVTAGPEGLALTLRPGHGTRALAKLGSARPGMSVRDDRLVFARGSLPGADPLAQREAILAAMA